MDRIPAHMRRKDPLVEKAKASHRRVLASALALGLTLTSAAAAVAAVGSGVPIPGITRINGVSHPCTIRIF